MSKIYLFLILLLINSLQAELPAPSEIEKTACFLNTIVPQVLLFLKD